MAFLLTFRLLCACGDHMTVKVDPDRCPGNITPKVAAMRAGASQGWKYRGGRMGKTVMTVVCLKCRGRAMFLEADIDPRDAVPATFEDDVAIPLDATTADAQPGGQGGTT